MHGQAARVHVASGAWNRRYTFYSGHEALEKRGTHISSLVSLEQIIAGAQAVSTHDTRPFLLVEADGSMRGRTYPGVRLSECVFGLLIDQALFTQKPKSISPCVIRWLYPVLPCDTHREAPHQGLKHDSGT